MPTPTEAAPQRPAGTPRLLDRTQRLLASTLRRLRWAVITRRALFAFFALAAGYCVAVLVARLTGAFSLNVPFWTPAVLPLVALVLGAIWPNRPGARDAARAIDRGAGTNDLYLTMVLLEGSAGEYQPLVAAKAESRAATIRPREVAPLKVNRRLTSIAAVLAVVVAAVPFVPQLDPFGKVAAAEETREELRHVEESKQATKERLAKIERENLSNEEAKEVQQALEQLKAAMKATQVKARQANGKLIAGAQKTVAGEWRKISSEKLNDLFAKSAANAGQEMGAGSSALSKKWLEDLQSGSTESIKKELAAVQRDLEELAKTMDPARKAELAQKLRERLDALSQFANEQSGSKPLAAALKRTQEQMRMAAKAAQSGDPQDPAAQEALKAAAESAKLADKELEQIAQSAKDLNELEKALSVLQKAKQLNNSDLLDGSKMDGLQSMSDYEAMYDKMMKGAQPDMGEFGEGGPAEENDSKKSGFKTELSKSQIAKGKVLLTLKTKGMGDPAEVKEQYRTAVRDVKQNLSEAILREEIPPGYHEGIKGYFDSIDETPAPGK
jgi:hypothetical protein